MEHPVQSNQQRNSPHSVSWAARYIPVAVVAGGISTAATSCVLAIAGRLLKLKSMIVYFFFIQKSFSNGWSILNPSNNFG